MDSVVCYFKEKAKFYDDVDDQPYWVFSDEILWHLLKSFVLPTDDSSEFSLLDAGGGTARWTKKIIDSYQNATATLVDISPDMLKVAKEKVQEDSDRVNCILQDLHELTLPNKKYDIVICFHNVIGFCANPSQVLENLSKHVKKGGKIAVMFPSFYHALYFSNSTARVGQYENITQNKYVQYNDKMPPLSVFTREDIEHFASLIQAVSFKSYGFPITVYPGMEETFIHGSTKSIVSLFSDAETRMKLLEIEKRICSDENLFSRGNNIITVFEF